MNTKPQGTLENLENYAFNCYNDINDNFFVVVLWLIE